MRLLKPPHVLIFGIVLAAAFIIALFPFFPRQLDVDEGDVASRDMRSPVDKTFESEVLTEQAREAAAAAQPEVLAFDGSVRTEQISALDQAASRASQVRVNSSLDEAAKRARLLGIPELRGLSRSSIDTILALSGDRWRQVVDEAERVLGGILSGSLDAQGVQTAQDDLNAQVSPELESREANLVAELVRPLIVPTLVVDQAATEEARQTARENVEPVRQTVAKGQFIVEAGQPVDATAVEVLDEVGLLSPRVEFDNLAAVILVALLAAALLAVYVWLFPSPQITSIRNLVLLALIVAVPVAIAKLHFSLVLPDDSRRFIAYLLPLAAAPMLVAALLGARLAIVIGLLQAALMVFAIVSLPDLSLVETIEPVDASRVLFVYGLGGVVGAYAARRAEHANQYVLGGVLVTLVTLTSLFAVWLLEPEREAFDALWMTGAAAVNGLGAGLLTAGGLVVVGAVLGVTTRVQLMELSQLNAPLLRRLQDEAPGTFHHSIIVGNLAERAADLIGADALLVRVGCYYHDLGKVMQPGYYIENQLGGGNPHDRMDPKDSARIIAQHVTGGLELARKHGLPSQVQDFIPEHHGTRLIPYFYRMASQRDPNVDERMFRYPGPRPQSRETAIVMLADGTEAMVRASDDRSPERIDALVEEVVAERLSEGELDECDLTLRDIRTIAASFKQTLRGVYHPRIAYPEPTEQERGVHLGWFRPGRRVPIADPVSRPRPADAPSDASTPASRRRAT